MKRSILIIIAVGVGLLVTGCSSAPSSAPTSQPNAVSPTTVPATPSGGNTTSASNNASNTNGQAPNDACTILTSSAIKSIMGLELGDGVSKPSYIKGSTCQFKSTKKGESGDILLQIGVGKDYYLGDLMKPGEAESAGIGDKSFIQGPGEPTILGYSASIGALKGNTVVLITVNSRVVFTADQAKALLKTVMDQLPS